MLAKRNKWYGYHHDDNSGNGNGKQKPKENEKPKQESFSQVYRSHSTIAEAILIDDQPKWLVSTAAGNISIQDDIEISDDEILKPFVKSSYVNRPYRFGTLEELQKVIAETKNETLDTLYYKVKKIWTKYIAEGDNHLSICSADCIFSYFQDKMGLTHYLFFVGDNDSGKSNNLHIINFLAYRNMLSSDMTGRLTFTRSLEFSMKVLARYARMRLTT